MKEFEPMLGRVQMRSQSRSNEKAKHVQTSSQTCSDQKPNTFEQEAKHVGLRSQLRLNKSQTRSNEKPTAFNNKANAFRRKTKRVRSASTRIWEKRETHLNENFPAFERDPTRVWMTTFTSSNEDQYAFKWGPSCVQMRIYTSLTVNWTRSFHVWNAFAFYLVSDRYCMWPRAVVVYENFYYTHSSQRSPNNSKVFCSYIMTFPPGSSFVEIFGWYREIQAYASLCRIMQTYCYCSLFLV